MRSMLLQLNPSETLVVVIPLITYYAISTSEIYYYYATEVSLFSYHPFSI